MSLITARTSQMNGLSASEAAARLAHVGPNALPERRPDPLWLRFVRQFNSPLIFILLFALAFDAGLWVYEGAHGWPIEASAIALILLFNAALGLYQEQRSEAALTRLKALAGAHAWVLRDGELLRLSTHALVPGDWVRLEAGDRVPADGTLHDAHGALFDESILTGESVPVDKGVGDEAFSGTLLVRGKTFLDVTRTGSSSAMGRLATMLGDIQLGKTPLERRVDILGHQIARWVLALAAVLCVLGIMAEGLARAPEMIIFAVALAVAAVPEGLPAVLTVALALGVERMARHRAVVRRLSAVEALGSVTVIATDKTGTLTESRMDVRSLDAPDLPRALRAVALANDADLSTGAGDPLDLGLLRYAAAHGVDVARLREEHSVVSERPFDSAWKFARTSVREQGHTVSYIKGAPEVLFTRCALSDSDRESWTEKARAYAQEGLRVLAIASAPGEAEDHLSLLGLALFWDPPRPEVPDAVHTALDAGIRVVMITGDHPETALAIAHQIGIPGLRVLTGEDLAEYQPEALQEALAEVNVFARVRPEQKLQLVESLQAQRQIVAMTGDGVNDAPALKRSDVGVAMGQRGSDVSREVADLVLLDDNFATIVGAVEEGRGIYENIQKFLRFLFSTNLSEVLLVAGGAVVAYVLSLRDEAGHVDAAAHGCPDPLDQPADRWPAGAGARVRPDARRHAAEAASRRLPPAGSLVRSIRRRCRDDEGAARPRGARPRSDVRVQSRSHARGGVSLHGYWSALLDVPVETHVDASAREPVPPRRGRRWCGDPVRGCLHTDRLEHARQCCHPGGTVGVVFVGAFVAWGVSEGIARFVWKNVDAASRP